MEKCPFCDRILSEGPGIEWVVCDRCTVRLALARIEKAERGDAHKQKVFFVNGIGQARPIPFIPKGGGSRGRPS